jgi:hypothetical protein
MHSIGNIRTTAMHMYKLEGELDPQSSDLDSIRFKDWDSIKSDTRAVLLADKKPKWSNAKNKYVYNFNGRCTVASIKNIQLISENHHFQNELSDSTQEHCMYQFGRWDKKVFNIDFYYPMSIINAFGLALSIFDTY